MRERTFNVTFRYSDEQVFRKRACGISTLDDLRKIVGDLACLCEVADIRIRFDPCKTDFKIFCP